MAIPKQLVSIVVPCHNCERFIERCVRSVVAQSHGEWELLLVDNNSTDGTLGILRRLEASRPDRIHVFIEARQGACAARNTGLKHAHGRWIQFLDADDELLPEKLAEQLKLLDDEVCFVAGDYIYKTAKAKVITRSRNDPFCGLIASNLGITSANLFTRRNLDAVGGWNEGLSSSQEYDLMFRLMKLNPHVVLDRRLHTVVHKTAGSIMTRSDIKNERTRNSLNLRLQIRDFLISTNQFTLARAYCFSAFVGTLVSGTDSQPREAVDFNRLFYNLHRLATSFSRYWRRLRWRRYGAQKQT